MNTLEIFKANPHSVYLNRTYQMTCSINLLEFGKQLFESAYVIDNLNGLKSLCENCSPRNPPKKEEIEGFTKNGLIDSIKISICFENFGKGMLLAKGYLIHNINKSVFSDLEDQQKKRPILIENFPDEWIRDDRLITTVSSLKGIGKGLLMNTINYSTMLNKNSYFQECLYDKEFLNFLKQINQSRNQLHMLNSFSFNLRHDSYELYSQLNEFVKTKIPKFQNQFRQYLDPNDMGSTPSFIIKKIN